MRLDEIMAKVNDLAWSIEDCEERGVVVPEDVALAFRELAAAENEKVDALAKVLRELEQDAETAKAEALRLRERADRFERQRARLVKYIAQAMAFNGVQRLKSALNTISLRKGSERVEVFDPEQLPEMFWVTPPQPEKRMDLRGIKEAIDSGSAVPGAKVVRGDDTVRVYQ